jgi:hypothetical protein
MENDKIQYLDCFEKLPRSRASAVDLVILLDKSKNWCCVAGSLQQSNERRNHHTNEGDQILVNRTGPPGRAFRDRTDISTR